MSGDAKPPTESALFRSSTLSLRLLGSVCLCVAGVMMVGWSLKYASVGKFTIMGGLAIVASLAFAALTLREIFKARTESNQASDA